MRLIEPRPLTEIVERIFAAGGCGAEEAGRRSPGSSTTRS